jgi:N-acyl homoserine lactone hydrolase
MSMLIRSEGSAPVLLVADACYSVEALMEDRFPGTGDRPAMREAFARIRELAARTPGLVIVPSHDPGAAEAVRTVWPRGSAEAGDHPVHSE